MALSASGRPSLLSERASGVLLHPTSLPGPFGAGDLGPLAFAFVDQLARAGQRWWQMLPVGPTGGGHSPYDSPSTFAGNPELVSLEAVANQGLLKREEIVAPHALARARLALFDESSSFREARLRLAAERFYRAPRAKRQRYDAFCWTNRGWLKDYTLFQALYSAHKKAAWASWAPALRSRRPSALAKAAHELRSELAFLRFVQFQFDEQWCALRAYCEQKGVLLLGDVPMFVSGSGADTWSHQDLFLLRQNGKARAQVGVPPDDFAEDGQRWGNPPYDWKAMAGAGFAWWCDRLRATLTRFDAVRLDHFIGLYRYWRLPADAVTARSGRFVRVPGVECLLAIERALGGLPFVAEDLGLIIPEVDQLRDRFGLPGMRVLQFGFSASGERDRPHFYPKNCVAYSGTHDHDTLVGWLEDKPAKPRLAREKSKALRFALEYAGGSSEAVHWALMRTVMGSSASTAIFPLQDLLGLDSSARMNVPGSASGNWRWRMAPQAFSRALEDKTRRLTLLYDRTKS